MDPERHRARKRAAQSDVLPPAQDARAGWIRGDRPGERQYCLGAALARIAILAQSTDELLRVAQPYLSRLVEITGETVDMTVWNESGPLLAAQVLSPRRWFQPVNTVGTVFTEAPTSHVKLWLAFGTQAQVSRLQSILTADRQGLAPSRHLPPGMLDAVREEGVAFDVGQTREVFSVAAPVFDAGERMVWPRRRRGGLRLSAQARRSAISTPRQRARSPRRCRETSDTGQSR